MHARKIALRAREGQFERLVGTIRGTLLPAAKRQPGYVGITMFSDREACRVVGTTWWRTESDMLAGEASGYLEEQLGHLAPLLSEPPAIERYDAEPRA